MPGAVIELPPPTTADAIVQLAKNVGQLGVVVAILLAMGAVAAEKERGTAAFVLTLPAGRAAFLGAKLLAIGFTLLVAVALAAAGDWLYTTILFEPLPIPDSSCSPSSSGSRCSRSQRSRSSPAP